MYSHPTTNFAYTMFFYKTRKKEAGASLLLVLALLAILSLVLNFFRKEVSRELQLLKVSQEHLRDQIKEQKTNTAGIKQLESILLANNSTALQHKGSILQVRQPQDAQFTSYLKAFKRPQPLWSKLLARSARLKCDNWSSANKQAAALEDCKISKIQISGDYYLAGNLNSPNLEILHQQSSDSALYILGDLVVQNKLQLTSNTPVTISLYVAGSVVIGDIVSNNLSLFLYSSNQIQIDQNELSLCQNKQSSSVVSIAALGNIILAGITHPKHSLGCTSGNNSSWSKLRILGTSWQLH